MAGRVAERGAGRQGIDSQYNAEDFHLTVPGCLILFLLSRPNRVRDVLYAT